MGAPFGSRGGGSAISLGPRGCAVVIVVLVVTTFVVSRQVGSGTTATTGPSGPTPTPVPLSITVVQPKTAFTAAAGEPFTLDVQYLNTTEDVPDLTVQLNPAMVADNRVPTVAMSVTAFIAQGFADPTSCTSDGDGRWSCGEIPQFSSAQVELTGWAPHAGSFHPGLTTSTDDNVPPSPLSNGDVGWAETITRAPATP